MKLESQICSGPNQHGSGNFFYNVLPSDCKKGECTQRLTQWTKHMARRATEVLLKQQVSGTRVGRESAASRSEWIKARIQLHRPGWKRQQLRTLQTEERTEILEVEQ